MLKEQSFEVREYEPHILAETIVDGDFDKAGSEKIDMTSPVGQQETDGRWAVSFMMPASYSLETLPEPQDPQVILREVPARHIAAVRCSGFWSEEGYTLNRDKLEAWIKKNRFSVIGGPIWARYDPLFMPWFLRRNEILVPIVTKEAFRTLAISNHTEQFIIAALRAANALTVSLVAEIDGLVIGHPDAVEHRRYRGDG